ncbi:MAG TPA: nucleotidyltransferase family protein [Croceibacterium sp.]|nr:nucleotidyltransferase family protein [Croceibacterium sp.]
MTRTLPAELALAAACCRWPPSPADEPRMKAAAAAVRDWDHFDAVVRRNRITPLVHSALGRARIELPAAMAASLADRAMAAARRTLGQARESLRLQRAFDAAGLPMVIVKGAPLAIIAYNEVGLKESWDIDLLVAPSDAAEAAGLLVELGYRGEFSQLDRGRLKGVLRHSKEAEFRHERTGITAELHWRLTDNRRLLRGIDVHAPTRDVPVAGGTLRTLADDELFSYLCAHGTVHNWSRLKWLADVGAILGHRSPGDIARLHEAAEGYGVGRCASVALLLARWLLDTPVDVRLPARDGVARALADNAIAGLAYRGGTFEMKPYSWPWVRMMAAHFFVARGAAHRLEQLSMLWNSSVDRSQLTLPRGMRFGYHLLRIPLWVWRVGTRAFARKRA